MSLTDLAVIGAGPAGLAAAVSAARAGVKVTLIDEYPAPGGQYLKGQVPPAGSWVSRTETQGRAYMADLAGLPVTLRLETLVWSLERPPDLAGWYRLGLWGPDGVDWLEAGAVIVATGARERVVPFPGWTLPGVMTVGAAQLLAKGSGVLPGRRLVLAGSGPLLLAAAAELVERGGQVLAVLEASRPESWLRHAPAVWGQWGRLAEGWHYLARLRRAGVPYRLGWTVVRAEGEGQLEMVELARLDRQGFPRPEGRRRLAADTLCLSFGFVPNVELTWLAGCAHDFDPAAGGWVPRTDERLETTAPNLFVAGETTGVAGAAAALLTGRLAGRAAAWSLGYITDRELANLLAFTGPARRRLRRFGAMLNNLFRPGPGLDSLITGETLLCRCEEVPAGEVRAAIAAGATGLDALKIWTRVGQGPCQGRTCGPILARLVARQTGRPEAAAGYFRVRPPLKPVPLEALALGDQR